jgi:hypothetical protein
MTGNTVKHLCLALALVSAATVVAAQTLPAASAPAGAAASTPSAAASSAKTAKALRRPLTPEEMRDSASFPGDLRPDGPPTPQIKVPLGRKPPPPSDAVASAARRDAAVSPSKIDDRVARCKGQPTAEQRAACAQGLAASSNRAR